MIGRIIAALLVVVSACSSTSDDRADVSFETSRGDVAVRSLEVADTTERRAQGLMGRTELETDAGMLFVYDEPSGGSFWMKDTLIPLSIAFWDADGVIHTIVEMDPCGDADPCPTYPAAAPYTFALEMNAGWFGRNGVEVGDRADVLGLPSS